ncbi:MAG: F0F1 ATP synthase subunit A [Marinicaulis sp.]|nr:F0F1 ATP synthase subunit A [Marinicaulis sp.]NNE39646.1 F0F1 ATP synthase subunit A [Marinicaulis sp.]NNL90394.1 F0F1 ATP synthase subunit A [Marinicaulis sp.]
MFNPRAAGPMEQFEILPIVPLKFGNYDISLTNSSLWMLIGTGAIILFFAFATRKSNLVPGRTQAMAETFYEFVSDLVRDTIGPEGRKFFPYVFTLFIWILIANLFGLLPSFPGIPHELHTFTPTSHLIVTLALAMVTITIVILYGFYKNGLGFFKLFAPSGVPLWLMPILVPVEVISFLSRPLSLAIRLFANMFAGHVILKLFAGFVVSLIGTGSAVMLFGIAPFLGAIAVTALEFLVAALQAYVFAVLTCIYLNDAVHASDH